MNEQRKSELLNRFSKYPFLALLISEFWFRVAVVGFVLFVTGFFLFVLKIWTMSPVGFEPVVKVSGLDLVQAWSLRRSGLRDTAAGKFVEADHAWRSAIANNPVDVRLIRGYLRNLLISERPERKSIGLAVLESNWLMRLGATNQPDLELVAEVYEKYQLYDLIVHVLKPVEASLTPKQQAAYAKASFHQRQMETFAERWELMGQAAQADAELPLYRAAYLAGWGPPEQAADGRERLRAATEDARTRVLAHRLLLAVYGRLGNVEGYGESLSRLEEWHGDKLLDHIGYWRLLAGLGQKAKAKQLAEEHPQAPQTASEAVRLAEVYETDLGMTEFALSFLQRYLAQFGYAPETWIAYARLLMDTKRWEDLRPLALQIRKEEVVRDRLAGFSYYLEGRAHLASSHVSGAESAFQKAAKFPFDNAALGLTTATSLIQLNFPAIGWEILAGLEKPLSNSTEYWNQVFTAAYKLKDAELMLKGAEKGFQLQPQNLIYINNYAAALLVNRQRADETIQLTLRLVAAHPNSTIARINHAMALLMNHRTDEAVSQIRDINVRQLTQQEASAFHLAWFQIHLEQRDFARAWQARDRIDPRFLFPPQVKWIEQAQEQMPARSMAKS